MSKRKEEREILCQGNVIVAMLPLGVRTRFEGELELGFTFAIQRLAI